MLSFTDMSCCFQLTKQCAHYSVVIYSNVFSSQIWSRHAFLTTVKYKVEFLKEKPTKFRPYELCLACFLQIRTYNSESSISPDNLPAWEKHDHVMQQCQYKFMTIKLFTLWNSDEFDQFYNNRGWNKWFFSQSHVCECFIIIVWVLKGNTMTTIEITT